MQDFLIVLEVLGIFFPIPGLLIMAVIAGLKTGRDRLYVFIFGPAIIFIIHVLLHFFKIVDGNLASAAALAVYSTVCFFYYVVLGVIGVIKGFEKWQNRKK